MVIKIINISIAFMLISSGTFSCTGKNTITNPENALDTIEGWVNDDTFQIAAGGMPVQSLKMIDQRKESARLDAIQNARFQIIKEFIGAHVNREGLKNDQFGGVPVSGELQSILKEGIVKKTVWDYDENCEILFEIKYPGLKKKVNEGVLK